jgi:hypothetical protein
VHGWPWKDDGGHVAIRKKGAKAVGIERLVTDKIHSRQVINQGFGHGRLVHLTGRVEQAQDIAEGVDGNVNIRAQPSTRSPERLF